MNKYLISTLVSIVLVSTAYLALNDISQEKEDNNNFNPQWSATNWAQKSHLKRTNLSQEWIDSAEKGISQVGAKFEKNSNGFTLHDSRQKIDFTIANKGFVAEGNDWKVSIDLAEITGIQIDESIGELTQISDFELIERFSEFDIQYLSTIDGLRQNFILTNSSQESSDISVIQNIESELESRIKANQLVFYNANQPVFKYHDLKVWDAENNTIKARMLKTNDNQLALNVNVEGAVFPLTIDPISSTYDWKVTGGQTRADLGVWIAGNGDMNGDGYDDVVLGAPGYEVDFPSQGAIFIYYGSPSGLALVPDKVIYGEQEDGSLGKCVSIEGDVNGDGFDDLLVGAHQIQNPHKNEGKAYLYYGGIDGIGDDYGWSFEANRKNAKLGEAVSMAGDVNGDGFEDVIIGAHGWDNIEEMGDVEGNKTGKFWIFHGSATGLSEVPAMECVADVTDANLAISVDKAGDVNGDGYDDFHIGGYIFLIGDGMICTFHGGPGGADATPDFMAVGGAEDTSFYAVNLSNAGDVNGDGYDDVVIGAPRFDTDGVYQSGKLHLHFGGPMGIDTNVAWIVSGTQYDERFAFNVNDAQDLNNDGYGDVLVTSKYFIDEALGDSVGKTLLYLGGPNGPGQQPQWEFIGETTNGAGTNTILAGDVNGDGQEDVLVSGTGYSGEYYSEGAVYGFYGEKYACDAPENLNVINITPNSAQLLFDWLYGAEKYRITLKTVGSSGSTVNINANKNRLNLAGLSPGTSYVVAVQGKCEAGLTDLSTPYSFTTPPLRLADERLVKEPTLYPNPVRDVLYIDFGSNEGEALLQVFDLAGNPVFTNSYKLEDGSRIELSDIQQFANGVYLFVMDINGQKTTKRVTVAN